MATAGRTIDDQQFATIAKALADTNRVAILQGISAADDTLSCSDMRSCLSVSAATLSHHMKELENAELIRIERVGKFAKLHLRRDVWKAYLKRLSEI